MALGGILIALLLVEVSGCSLNNLRMMKAYQPWSSACNLCSSNELCNISPFINIAGITLCTDAISVPHACIGCNKLFLCSLPV